MVSVGECTVTVKVTSQHEYRKWALGHYCARKMLLHLLVAHFLLPLRDISPPTPSTYNQPNMPCHPNRSLVCKPLWSIGFCELCDGPNTMRGNFGSHTVRCTGNTPGKVSHTHFPPMLVRAKCCTIGTNVDRFGMQQLTRESMLGFASCSHAMALLLSLQCHSYTIVVQWLLTVLHAEQS
jgi:hypothetical protein